MRFPQNKSGERLQRFNGNGTQTPKP